MFCKKYGKNIVLILVAVVAVLALIAGGVYFAVNNSGKKTKETSAKSTNEEEYDDSKADEEDESDDSTEEENEINSPEESIAELMERFTEVKCPSNVSSDSDLEIVYSLGNFLSKGGRFAFDEIAVEMVSSASLDGYATTDNLRAEYTVFDNGVACLRFVGMNIYASGDDSYTAFFFIENDGELTLTYTYDSWARNDYTIYEGPVLVGYGSGGAGDNYEWAYYIDEAGKKQIIYDDHKLSGEWAYDYNKFDFSNPDEDHDGLDTVELQVLEIGDKKYVCCTTYDGEKKPVYDRVVEPYLKDGYERIETQSECMQVINDSFRKAGFDDSESFKEPNWTLVDLSRYKQGSVITE